MVLKKQRMYQNSLLLQADTIQSDGERNLIGRRSVYDDKTQQTEQKNRGRVKTTVLR